MSRTIDRHRRLRPYGVRRADERDDRANRIGTLDARARARAEARIAMSGFMVPVGPVDLTPWEVVDA